MKTSRKFQVPHIRCRAVGLALSGAAFALICIKCFAVNALQNPDFEVDLAGWEITASAPSPATYVNHWPYGWNNSAGSLGLTADLINGNASEVTAMQCVNEPARKLDASVEVFPFDAPEQSIVGSHLFAYASQDCAGNLLSLSVLAPAAPLQTNSWTTLELHENMPEGTASVLLDIVVSTGSGFADYMIDHAHLELGADTILASGFEPMD